MLCAVLTLVAVARVAVAGAGAGVAPAPCLCVPTGRCGGLIREWEEKTPAKCAAGGGECCDLDALPVAEVAQPGKRRIPTPPQPALKSADIGYVTFSPAPPPLPDRDLLHRPELTQDFDIELPESAWL